MMMVLFLAVCVSMCGVLGYFQTHTVFDFRRSRPSRYQCLARYLLARLFSLAAGFSGLCWLTRTFYDRSVELICRFLGAGTDPSSAWADIFTLTWIAIVSILITHYAWRLFLAARHTKFHFRRRICRREYSYEAEVKTTKSGKKVLVVSRDEILKLVEHDKACRLREEKLLWLIDPQTARLERKQRQYGDFRRQVAELIAQDRTRTKLEQAKTLEEQLRKQSMSNSVQVEPVQAVTANAKPAAAVQAKAPEPAVTVQSEKVSQAHVQSKHRTGEPLSAIDSLSFQDQGIVRNFFQSHPEFLKQALDQDQSCRLSLVGKGDDRHVVVILQAYPKNFANAMA